jgi:DNA invertase Pin-like site-specific DNA recombinase
MKYGYARLSTDGQSVDAQVKELRADGAEKVFRETASGAQTNRAQLARALAQLGKGDVLTVTRLDRLARSTRDLLNTLATVTAKGAAFRSLGDTWTDTTTAHGRLMLTVLGGLAEFESELIRARTGEGRKRAKERGVHMGRRPKLTAHQRRDAPKALADGTATLPDFEQQVYDRPVPYCPLRALFALAVRCRLSPPRMQTPANCCATPTITCHVQVAGLLGPMPCGAPPAFAQAGASRRSEIEAHEARESCGHFSRNWRATIQGLFQPSAYVQLD